MKIKTCSDGEDFNVLASACGKGNLIVMDIRAHSPIIQQRVHSGAINFLDIDSSYNLITASADQSAKILNPFRNWEEETTITSTSSILCGEAFQDILVVGCADGNILVYDTSTSECLFGYGADNQGGVNCLTTALNHRKLVTGGENGVPLLINFE